MGGREEGGKEKGEGREEGMKEEREGGRKLAHPWEVS